MAGLHHNRPERAVVLCVDEKSGIQAYPVPAGAAFACSAARPVPTGADPESHWADYSRPDVPYSLPDVP